MASTRYFGWFHRSAINDLFRSTFAVFFLTCTILAVLNNAEAFSISAELQQQALSVDADPLVDASPPPTTAAEMVPELLAATPMTVQRLKTLLTQYMNGKSELDELYAAACAMAVGELEMIAQQFKQYMSTYCVGWTVGSDRFEMPRHCFESIENARGAHDKYYAFLLRHCPMELQMLRNKYQPSRTEV